MFDRISPAYDRMNRLMSLGMDGGWRSLAVRCTAVRPGDAGLDVCCGTGDLALALLAVAALGHLEALLPTVPDALLAVGKVAAYALVTAAGAAGAATPAPRAWDGRRPP